MTTPIAQDQHETKERVAEDLRISAIRDYQTRAYENAKAKGFHLHPTTVPERLMLIVSELSEALESYRNGEPMLWATAPFGHPRDGDRLVDGEVTLYVAAPDDPLPKPEGVAAELADAFIRIMDMCGAYGIDLGPAIEAKMRYNATRPYRHGGKAI